MQCKSVDAGDALAPGMHLEGRVRHPVFGVRVARHEGLRRGCLKATTGRAVDLSPFRVGRGLPIRAGSQNEEEG